MKYILILLIIGITISLWSADFQFAKELFEDGLYGEALIELEKVVQEKPTSTEAENALFLIGQAYSKQEQFAAAETAFLRLWNGYPNSDLRDQLLLYLARVQFKQKKYHSAIENFQRLFNDYPMSDFTKQAPVDYLQALYKLEQFDKTISEAHQIIENYPTNEQIPAVYLWLIRAYFSSNMNTEGENTLEILMQKYPNSNAYWQAVEYKIVRLEETKNGKAALEFLSEKLQQTVPRKFEEALRWKEANLFLEANQYEEAYKTLQHVVSKFSFSESLDEYLVALSKSMLFTERYEEIPELYQTHQKVFENSPEKANVQLILAESYQAMKKYQEAEHILKTVLQTSKNDAIQFSAYTILAETYVRNHQAKPAIETYKFLINHYAEQGENGFFLRKIGDIYFQVFEQYQVAKQYYQNAISIVHNSATLAELYFQFALCEEHLGNFTSAYNALMQIEKNEITEDFAQKIEDKIDFLTNFQIKDYKSAVEKLVIALLDENKTNMNEELIDILSDDLKEFEIALQVMERQNQMENFYEQAKIRLKILKKNQFAGNLQEVNSQKERISNLIEQLQNNEKMQQSTELSIRLQIAEKDSLDSEIIAKLNSFINTYPESIAANEFRYRLGTFWKSSDMEKAIPYFSQLKMEKPIRELDFTNAILSGAEYYYHQDKDTLALENYEKVRNSLNLNRPEEYFHYLVAKIETEKPQQDENSNSVDLSAYLWHLRNLVNNVTDFPSYDNAILYVANQFRKQKNYEMAIDYLLRKKEKDDSYYSLLVSDYLALGNQAKAKEMLLYIQDKNYEQLKQLAILQLQTGDFSLAKYSFEQLLSENKKDVENYRYLGHLYFVEEEFTKAVEYLEQFFTNRKADMPQEQPVKELVISLFRIQNRPRAEGVWKEHKKNISEEANQQIELNEGIYYKDINAKKAEKIFASLIKNGTEEIRMEAYFWRGVTRLEQKQSTEAKYDFEKAVYADDPQLVNEANLKLGTIYFSEENYEKSLHHYYQVIQSDEKGDLALSAAQNFAYVCKTIEEWQKAIEAYEIILARWGDETLQANTIFDIAFCYFRDKKYEHAVEMFSQSIPLLEDKETEAEAQYWIAESFAGLEQYERAITEFLKVSYNYSAFPHWAASAELRAGECYIKLRQFDRAIQIYERIITKYGRYSDWGKQAQERLEQLKQ